MAYDHDHPHGSQLDPMTARVMALETLLTEKGLVDPAALDALVELYEHQIGPRNGARVVARAWADPGFADWLARDATAAIASLGYTGRQGEHMRAVFNTAHEHNLVVCTLCSCYPWAVLGLPPVWYKSPPYRSRAVIDPRGVLAEFGVTLPAETAIRVWDFTAELRYLVVPMRPAGSEGLPEAALADLVSRDAMIGTGLALDPVNGPQDLGGQMGFGPVAPEADEPVFHAPWEKRALALTLAAGAMGHWTIDESRHARESLHPADYYGSSYYEIWIKALERLLARHGFVTEAELAAGRSLAAGPAPKRVLKAADVPAVIARGGPTERDPGAGAPAFAPGDRVRARNLHPAAHTRLPRYARGRVGRVEAVRGFHVFPDSNAHGAGEAPQWLYGVAFDGRELWGADADPATSVALDAWESYLERA